MGQSLTTHPCNTYMYIHVPIYFPSNPTVPNLTNIISPLTLAIQVPNLTSYTPNPTVPTLTTHPATPISDDFIEIYYNETLKDTLSVSPSTCICVSSGEGCSIAVEMSVFQYTQLEQIKSSEIEYK